MPLKKKQKNKKTIKRKPTSIGENEINLGGIDPYWRQLM